jgi:hypothetical protein
VIYIARAELPTLAHADERKVAAGDSYVLDVTYELAADQVKTCE